MQQSGSLKATARSAFFALGLFAMSLLGVGVAFGQVTGKVEGTVTDRDTGEPLVGAQVVIGGTNLGNVSNEDGYYFINNVAVGVQSIIAQYLGFQTTTQEWRILAGQTMTVQFTLSSEVVQIGEIMSVMETEPLLARDNTISKSRFTGEMVRNMPMQNLGGVISLGAGIYQSRASEDVLGMGMGMGGGGFIIRGGRGSESATYVDGALITDFSTQRNVGLIGTFAVEEADVITGGFNAEFGHAQSGVINIVTREGGEAYHGNIRYTTDGRFSTDGYELAELAQGVVPEEQKCCGFNELQVSLGGPVIPDKLTVFGSFAATGAADIDPRSEGYNPAVGVFNSSGSSETILPGARGDNTRAQAKLTSFLTGTSKLTGTYLYSRDQAEAYCDFCSLAQFLSTATRDKTQDIILGYEQQIFQDAERNLNLQVRGNFHQTKLFGGTPRNATSAAVLNANDRLAGQCGADCNVDGHTFDEDFLNYRFGDVEFFFEDAFPGDPDLLNVGGTLSTLPDPVFGHPQIFASQGFENSFFKRDERRYGLRADLDAQLNRVHRAKVGGEYTWINFSETGGQYTDAVFAQLFDVDPRVAALYAQDRLDYGDLVIDLGLRVDYWDPNTDFPLFPGVVPCSISAFTQCSDPADDDLAVVVEGQTRTELSPRLGVAHPITDATQVRLSYGKFYQLPELRHYFSAFRTDFVATGGNSRTLYGNPNLDYVETTAFEAGITHLLSEDLVLDVVAYNRDRRGAIRVDVFQPNVLAGGVGERRIFVNGDNGNVKGFDLTLNKRYANYFSTDVAYSLQFARGTTSSPTEFATGFGLLFDPLFPGRLLVPPSELSAETFDRTHSFTWQFNLLFPDDFMSGTTWGTILNDFGAYVVYNAHSGEPFTRRSVEGPGEPLEDPNTSRLPWFHQGDLRVIKGIHIGDAFDFEVFAQVLNFLDIENILAVSPTTGRPDRTGFEDNLSRTPTITSGFRTADSRQDYPFVIATDIRPEFQSRFARQDLNGDGSISLAEAQETLRQALIASGRGAPFSLGNRGDSPFNYGEPRQVRFGAEIRF